MYTTAVKSIKGSEYTAAAETISQPLSRGKDGSGFVDNRPKVAYTMQMSAMDNPSETSAQMTSRSNFELKSSGQKGAGVIQLLSDDDRNLLRNSNWNTIGPKPTDHEMAAMDRFNNSDEIQRISCLPQVTSWTDLAQLGNLTLDALEIIKRAGINFGGPPTLTQIIATGRFDSPELEGLAHLPQVTTWAELEILGSLIHDAPDIIKRAGTDFSGLPTLAQIIATGRFSYPELEGLARLPQVTTWADLVLLGGLTRNAGDIIRIASGTPAPTLAEIAAIERFTIDELGQIFTANRTIGIGDVAHLATIRDTTPNLVTLGKDANLAHNPWLTSRIHEAAHAGNLGVDIPEERNLACWNFAVRGFQPAPTNVSLIPTYFSFRTDFPSGEVQPMAHAEATNLAAGNQEEIDYLNGHRAQLQGVIDDWRNGALVGDQRNEEAQRAIMEMILMEAGFEVLPDGSDARWYICMHEKVTNVGWEHWWIRSKDGDVLQKFPYRDPAHRGDGGGRTITYQNTEENHGGMFRHQVPVADLLIPQKRLIKRDITNLGMTYTDDLPE
jgi:hypothetical protein